MNNLQNSFLILSLVFTSTLTSTVQLDSAEVPPTCQVREMSNPVIADLCASIANEARAIEYLHCFPTEASKESDIIPHYIFQKLYTDKENWEGESLGGLFIGFGTADSQTSQLSSIRKIDDQLSVLTNAEVDLSFESKSNQIKFDLVVISNDGELLEGTISDAVSKSTTKVNCMDISLEN